MRKISKILTLVLVLMALVTAFTVVALADDSGEAAPTLTPVKGSTVDFEDRAHGQNYSNSASKDGKWTTYEADNGNIYVSAEAEDVSGTTTQENIDPGTGRATSTNIQNYPTAAFDFDIRSTTGSLSSVSVRYDIYGGGGNWRITQGVSSYLSYVSELGKANEWQHVTVIVRHEGDGLFRINFYVDGVLSTYTITKNYAASDPVNNPNEAIFSATNATNKDTYGIYNWNNLLNEDGTYKYNNIGINYFSIYACDAGREIHFDNFAFNFFPESYTNDDVASYVYNSDYEMPYGTTEAKINDTYYDDLDKALLALKDGDRLTLKTDLEGDTFINNAVTVDTNKYDTNGNPTGEYYQASVKSVGGYVVSYDAGVYTLTKSDKNATVVFDPDCGEADCDCYAYGVGHRFTQSAITVPVGVVPEFFGETTVFTEEGVLVELLGWSYTKGGEVADLTAVTEEQADAGILNIYPVCNITKYDFAVTDADNNETYHSANEFEAKIVEAMTIVGGKITLYSDIECYLSVIAYSDTSFTLDLNGHTLTRAYLTGSKYKFDTAAGDYAEATVTDSKAFIYGNSVSSDNLQARGCTFNMVSSKPGAIFRTYAGTGNVWYDADGNFVRKEITAVTGGAGLAYLYASNASLNLENIEIYSLGIINNTHNGSSLKINITGCKFYRTTGGSETAGGYGWDFMYVAGGATVNVTDSLLYFPSSSVLKGDVRLVRVQGSSKATITFDNVDLITENINVQIRLEHANHSFIFRNSRVYNTKNEQSAYKPTFEGNVISTDTIANASIIAEDYRLLDKAQTITYSLPTVHRVGFDSETGNPTFNFAFGEKPINFTKQSVLYSDYFTKVTWLDENGELIEVSEEVKNELATAPELKIPVGDGYRAFTNPDWLDENGEKVSLVLGTLDEYTFKMSTELPEEPVYVADMTSAMFSMTYYGHFAYNLYAPALEGVTIVQLGDYAPKLVKINGQDYWTANAGWPDPKSAIKDLTKYIVYNIDGQEFTATFKISALTYASLLLSDTETVEVEKNSALAMMTYVEEVYKYVAGETGLAEDTQAKFDEFFTTYNAGARYTAITEYPSSEVYTIDEEFANYGVSISYGIDATNRMTILVTLSADEVAKGYKLTMSEPVGFSGSKTNDDGSVTYYTNNAKLYSTIMSSKYVITIRDSEDKALATTNYSLATYCTLVDSDLADALYTFGKALITAREEYLEKL